jgi:hypothetical protein
LSANSFVKYVNNESESYLTDDFVSEFQKNLFMPTKLRFEKRKSQTKLIQASLII